MMKIVQIICVVVAMAASLVAVAWFSAGAEAARQCSINIISCE